jgi:hypothetical protein
MTIYRTVSFFILLATLSVAQVSWNTHIIHNSTYGTSSVHACDLDNDGDTDVLGAVLEESQMVWWRNEGGYPITWTKFTIAYNFFQAFSVYAADLDNDGDKDIIGAAGAGDEVAWWSNDGGTPIQWTYHTIRTGYDFAHEVYAYDLDDDKDMDVFGASTDLDLISWWRNDGGTPIQWTEQTIGSGFDGAKSVRVADFDGDGDNDVVGACLYGNKITWWRNDGGTPIQWTEHVIDSYFYGAHRVQTIDIDEDQNIDILAAAYYNGEVAWYRNNGGNPLTWTKYTVGYGLAGACIAQAADVDDDGDLDVVATAQVSDEVSWWRNDGGSPIVWTKFYIDAYLDRAWPLYVCDLDADGDSDVVAASSWQGTAEVKWYENLGTGITGGSNPIPTSPRSGPTIMHGSAILPLDPEERLLDITGREVKPRNLPPGVYFRRVEGNITDKVIVVR